MKLDEKMLPLETQFANFGPVERVDLCIALQGRTQQLQQDGASEDCRNTMGKPEPAGCYPSVALTAAEV